MLSYTLSQILLKNFFGKVVFQFFGHVTFREAKFCFFGLYFETVQSLRFYLLEYG